MSTSVQAEPIHRHHDFEHALRAAIVDRGLALSRIQHHVQERGLDVGVSTLSYWQNGERVPRSAASMRVVTALEEVLGVPPKALTGLLHDQPAGAPEPWCPRAQMSTLTGYADVVDRLLDGMGGEVLGRTETVSTVEGVTVGPSGSIDSVHVIQVLRALRDVDRVIVVWQGEQGSDVSRIEVEPVAGCRIGRVRREEDRALVVAELIFDRIIRPPQTRMLQYVVRDGNDVPSHDYYRLLPRPEGMKVIEVVFHPERVPYRVNEFFRKRLDGPDVRSAPMVLHDGHRAHLALEHAGPGVVGVSWEYP